MNQTRVRWLGRFVGITAVILVSSCTTAAYMTLANSMKDRSPPMLADLSGSWEAVSINFDERIKARFPVGSPMMAMARVLDEQGFQHDWSCPNDQDHLAWWEGLVFPSRALASIRWRTDSEGRIVKIEGSFRALYSL